MENLKHTPGEWWACCTKAKPHYVFTKDCELAICSIIQKQELSTDLPLEQVQANAKLIAAAPKMLDALLKLQYAVKHGNVKGLFEDEKKLIDNAINEAIT